jgi:tetratricopeptide (TPR) repeat protein
MMTNKLQRNFFLPICTSVGRSLLISTVVGLICATDLPAQLFPGSENLWSNKEFQQRFLGSYGFDTDITPKVSGEEQEILKALLPLIAQNPAAAAVKLASSVSPEASAALDYTLGNLYVQSNEPEKAMAAYRVAIQKFPNFFRAYKNLGLVLVNEGEFEKALPFLRKGLELGGTDGSLYGPIGLALLNLGRPAQALTAYRQALLFDTGNIQWQTGKLRALFDVGHHLDASALLDTMIANDPANHHLWVWQANTFLSLESFEKAAANLEIVKRLGKADSASLGLLGDIYLKADLHDLALDNYLAASELAELDSERLIRTARGFIARRLWVEADTYLAKTAARAESLSPREQGHFFTLQAQAAIELDQIDRAAELLEKVIAHDPMNGNALLTFGQLQQRQGLYVEAGFAFEQAAKVEATRVNALVQHARMLVANRDYGAAVPLLERAIILEPGQRLESYLERVQQAARANRI